MRTRLAPLILALCLLGTQAAAQLLAGPVNSDLNGDGTPERFTLQDGADGIADLVIERTGGGTVFATDIAWVGGIGQQPELDVASNGSVRLTSMNEAIGRNRWRLTLTIAFRSGTYRVAGLTYSWYDTLNLPDNGTCDVNLLNGRGELILNGGPKQAIRVPRGAPPVTEWKDDRPLPKACGH